MITIEEVAAMINSMPKADTTHIRRKWLDIPYATVSPTQRLDVYLPDDGMGPFPVILAIHGGAFVAGNKADAQLTPVLDALKRDYAVVSVEYRQSDEALFPALVHDLKTAVRWVRAHATNYGFDPVRIGVWGSSAGGMLSALLGTSAHTQDLDDVSLGHAEQSSAVQAVVDWFGAANLLTIDAQFKARGVWDAAYDALDSSGSRIMGGPIAQLAQKVRTFDPTTYVTPDSPPFFIQHGTQDKTYPYEQSIYLAESLAKATGSKHVTLELLPGAGHGTPGFSDSKNIAQILNFLDQHLKR